MKFAYGSLIFIAAFMLYYFILSAIGALFTGSYVEVISEPNWFMGYSLIIGWWAGLLSTHDILEKYFKD